MNQKNSRGVLLMYKESRAIGARLNATVQEYVLKHPGGDVESVEARREADQRASGETVHAEWELLLVENAPLAFRVARGVLRNDSDAEDVAQEALLRAHRKFERLRERGKFRAWLVRISFRIALDRLRSVKRRQQREAQWAYENSRGGSQERNGTEFQRQFERAMEELPEKQRLVLLLAAMEGHSLDEVSNLLGVPVGTVKSRLFFARKSLREKLQCFVNPTVTR
jgi:RNA polymerase sigma-70 factor (ECF subfamily)